MPTTDNSISAAASAASAQLAEVSGYALGTQVDGKLQFICAKPAVSFFSDFPCSVQPEPFTPEAIHAIAALAGGKYDLQNYKVSYTPDALAKFVQNGGQPEYQAVLADAAADSPVAPETAGGLPEDEEVIECGDADEVAESAADEEAALAESIEPADVVTVSDFIELLETAAKPDDRLVFRYRHGELGLFKFASKSGVAVADLIEAAAMPLREKENVAEGRGWYGGGYGGTGRSYRSLGGSAPRGAEIGWYAVEQLDPKAKGKMPGWRMGPANFKFTDLLYPDRNYKVGTTVMRNKYVKAGSESGVKYIAVPSYFDSIKNKDEAALGLLTALGIPLDLTFGMDPNDDYSMTYTVG